MNINAVYAGTFDPVTHGHTDVLLRAANMYHQVIVAVAESPGKEPLFDLAKRTELIRAVTQHKSNISIVPFSGLLVEFAKRQEATVIVRGLRSVTDFDYEMQLASFNRKMAPQVATVYLTAAGEYSFISSSLVREIAKLGGDVTAFVNPVVEAALRERLG